MKGSNAGGFPAFTGSNMKLG